ncbi:MAG: nucleoporin NDC1 [Elusimicrobia bacterium]|nr:nucleoporin NDC1 [Candidatus Liberimonas magnetica]
MDQKPIKVWIDEDQYGVLKAMSFRRRASMSKIVRKAISAVVELQVSLWRVVEANKEKDKKSAEKVSIADIPREELKKEYNEWIKTAKNDKLDDVSAAVEKAFKANFCF